MSPSSIRARLGRLCYPSLWISLQSAASGARLSMQGILFLCSLRLDIVRSTDEGVLGSTFHPLGQYIALGSTKIEEEVRRTKDCSPMCICMCTCIGKYVWARSYVWESFGCSFTISDQMGVRNSRYSLFSMKSRCLSRPPASMVGLRSVRYVYAG